MSYTKLNFTKDWSVMDPSSSQYFPTIETDEQQVRDDIQLLFDECKGAINGLSSELDEAAPFIVIYGVTTYAQITAAKNAGLTILARDPENADMTLPFAGVSAGKYVFSGMAGNTRYSCMVTSANAWSRTSSALATLASPAMTGNPTAPTQAVGNNSTRLATTAFVKAAIDAVKSGWDALVTMFTGISSVVTTLGNDDTTIPTSKAVSDAIVIAGGGDMMKARYDTTNTGNKVDTALNAEKLGGTEASGYVKTSDVINVAHGGTGLSTLASGQALIGAGSGNVTTRAITNNTTASAALTASTNLLTMNTLRWALNRTTGPAAADVNYTTAMMRAIMAQTNDPGEGSALTSGMILLIYE